ncbi:MAG TPA: hypothetical protein VGH47_15905 [Xanthobacteraceae bacterium]|jgi:hypothetical protein
MTEKHSKPPYPTLTERIAELEAFMKAELISERIDQLENDFAGLEQEVNSVRNAAIAIGNWTADLGSTMPAMPVDQPIRRLLNGSWPQRDGNTYPSIRGQRTSGPYEFWVPVLPPATE